MKNNYGDMFNAYETVRHVSNYIDNNPVDFIYQPGDYSYGDDRDPMLLYNYEVVGIYSYTNSNDKHSLQGCCWDRHEHRCGVYSFRCDFINANNFTVYNNRFNMPAAEVVQ